MTIDVTSRLDIKIYTASIPSCVDVAITYEQQDFLSWLSPPLAPSRFDSQFRLRSHMCARRLDDDDARAKENGKPLTPSPWASSRRAVRSARGQACARDGPMNGTGWQRGRLCHNKTRDGCSQSSSPLNYQPPPHPIPGGLLCRGDNIVSYACGH